ncbi:MAG: hypothetical protein WDM76_01775 [Limisphaerales bacterium]
MNRLSKEKRAHLILAIIGTVAVLLLIYLGLIRAQYAMLSKIEKDKADKIVYLQQIQDAIKKAETTSGELANAVYNLSQAETDVASGDIYAWTYDTIRRFKANYRVDIPSIGQPALGDVDVLTGFPYRQLKVNLTGTAYYHDFGRFVSELENTFPHVRVVNLTLEPASAGGADNERLAFKMDVIALVKNSPNSRDLNPQ